MEATDLVLYVTSRVETVPGRTALQKLCYFVNVKSGAGVPFKAHYYGPYSPDIARATDSLLVFDLIEERKESGSLSSPWVNRQGAVITDWERRSYSLSVEGKAYWEKAPKEGKESLATADDLIEKLRKATRLDAKKLATLAKVHFLIDQNNLAADDIAGIISTAKDEGWRITEGGVRVALKSLALLQL